MPPKGTSPRVSTIGPITGPDPPSASAKVECLTVKTLGKNSRKQPEPLQELPLNANKPRKTDPHESPATCTHLRVGFQANAGTSPENLDHTVAQQRARASVGLSTVSWDAFSHYH